MSHATYRLKLAEKVAFLEGQAGRAWRSLEDVGTGVSFGPGPEWANWSRVGRDYYDEGTLLWLDVDTMIRAETRGRRSLDDFAVDFFGQGKETGPKVVPYTLEDIVSTLNKVLPHDWHGFFQRKVLDVLPDVNMEGIDRAGYRFIYIGEPTAGQETEAWTIQAVWNSLGIKVSGDGRIEDVRRGGPADTAKLAPRQTLTKVGGSKFTLDALVSEVKLGKQDRSGPVRLTLTQEGDEWEVELDYHDGLRYPQVVHRGGDVDMVETILAPKDVEPTLINGRGNLQHPTEDL
jgi:predicted metalloprotease with PDZ domain